MADLQELPYRPRLMRDECLSSYLSRLSYAYGTTVPDFLGTLRLARSSQSVTIRTLEEQFPREIVEFLARSTPNEEAELRMTGLQCFHGVVTKKAPRLGSETWLFTPDMYPEKDFTRLFTQFCPACLGGSEPHFKLTWRWSAVTMCTEHRVMLECFCPHCSSPVVPYLHSPKSDQDQVSRLRMCSHCGGDLSLSESLPLASYLSPPQIKGLVRFQELNLALLRIAQRSPGHILFGYFAMLDKVLSLIVPRRSKMIKDHSELLELLSYALRLKPIKLGYPRTYQDRDFDLMPPFERSKALLMVSLLLDCWPQNIESLRKRNSLIERALSLSTLRTNLWTQPSGSRDRSRRSRRLGNSLGHHFLAELLVESRGSFATDATVSWFGRPQDLAVLSDHYFSWQKKRIKELEPRYASAARYHLSLGRAPSEAVIFRRGRL